MSNAPKKPQAFSHMLWFFLLPCLGFLIWASSRWITEIYVRPQKKEALTLERQIEKIEKAKNPGDRWQAAYALSHFVQKSLADNSWNQIPEATKTQFYSRLEQLLLNHSTDHRLIKYAVLMLGQTKELNGLDLLLTQFNKNASTEINFFAGWSIVEILSSADKKGELVDTVKTKFHSQIETWLGSDDPALRKISGVYLIQFGNSKSREASLILLSDKDLEVRWNAIIALATVKDPRSEKPMIDIFNIDALRNVEFKSSKDIYQTLRSAYLASLKLNSPAVNEAIQKLKTSVRPSTPEGDAVLSALVEVQNTTLRAR